MKKEYAGFIIRVIAYFIDFLILMAVVSPFLFIWANSLPEMTVEEFESRYERIFEIIFIVILWLYYAILESSKFQATFGKKALNLKVTNYQGKPVSFMQASIRHFSKILSTFLLAGYVLVAFTKKKQGLHDVLAKTYVVQEQSAGVSAVDEIEIIDLPADDLKEEQENIIVLFFKVLVGLAVIYGVIFFVLISCANRLDQQRQEILRDISDRVSDSEIRMEARSLVSEVNSNQRKKSFTGEAYDIRWQLKDSIQTVAPEGEELLDFDATIFKEGVVFFDSYARLAIWLTDGNHCVYDYSLDEPRSRLLDFKVKTIEDKTCEEIFNSKFSRIPHVNP